MWSCGVVTFPRTCRHSFSRSSICACWLAFLSEDCILHLHLRLLLNVGWGKCILAQTAISFFYSHFIIEHLCGWYLSHTYLVLQLFLNYIPNEAECLVQVHAAGHSSFLYSRHSLEDLYKKVLLQRISWHSVWLLFWWTCKGLFL